MNEARHRKKLGTRPPKSIMDKESFRAVLSTGRRFNGAVIRCTHVVQGHSPGLIRVGIATPRGTRTAVERNRLKRLVREAVRLELGVLGEPLTAAGRSIAAVVGYRLEAGRPPFTVTLPQIREDVAAFRQSLTNTLLER